MKKTKNEASEEKPTAYSLQPKPLQPCEGMQSQESEMLNAKC